jgi:carbonate dehydratase
MISEILQYNQRFVAEKGYKPYETSGQPDMKLAIVSCMDTRLTELLPRALGLKNGDAKIIKVAGGTLLTPYDSVMRSLLVAIYELDCEEIMVIHHSGCGACDMHASHFLQLMRERGISEEDIREAEKHVDLNKYLDGFHDTPRSVRRTVDAIRQHPLVPKDITVRGFIIDSRTGKLEEVR